MKQSCRFFLGDETPLSPLPDTGAEEPGEEFLFDRWADRQSGADPGRRGRNWEENKVRELERERLVFEEPSERCRVHAGRLSTARRSGSKLPHSHLGEARQLAWLLNDPGNASMRVDHQYIHTSTGQRHAVRLNNRRYPSFEAKIQPC